MWIALSDSFLSIVHKDCQRDELLVRARRKGDIERIFPRAKVTRAAKADYRFRAAVKTSEVCKAISREVRRVTYSNFKDSVRDDDLHDAYLKFWNAMFVLQNGNRPFLFNERIPA